MYLIGSQALHAVNCFTTFTDKMSVFFTCNWRFSERIFRNAGMVVNTMNNTCLLKTC